MSSAIGRRVIVTGLQTNTALNGRRGVVTQGPNETKRPDEYIVHMEGIGERRFLSKNLELEETEEETMSMDKYRRHKITGEIAVIVDGLKESVHLNGLLGYVETKVGVDELGEDVYAVRLDKSGDKKQFRARHLHAIPIDHRDYGDPEYIDTSDEKALIERLAAEYKNNPEKFKRAIRNVRTEVRPVSAVPSAFQLSYNITASATPAIETKRLVVSWDAQSSSASVTKYKVQPGAAGNIYSKQEGSLSMEEFQSLYHVLVARIWSLPSLTEEGVDLYGYDVGLSVKVGHETWANAPAGCHADAELDEEQGGITKDNLDDFNRCVSFMAKLVENVKWGAEPVYIEGKNYPIGGKTAWGNSSETEQIVSSDDARIGDSSAAAAALSPQRNVPRWGEDSAGSGEGAGAGVDHLDMDVLKQLTIAQYKEKAGDVPFDENFVDEDWDMED